MWAAGHSNDAPAAEGVRTATLLLEAGADPRSRDDRGRDALMIAAARGHTAMIALLLDHGADLTARDNIGKTAMALAETDAARAALSRP
jgi:ankyrin repeat protein